ncbi:unnamed protein product [Brassica rapa subsp. trilocularis]
MSFVFLPLSYFTILLLLHPLHIFRPQKCTQRTARSSLSKLSLPSCWYRQTEFSNYSTSKHWV